MQAPNDNGSLPPAAATTRLTNGDSAHSGRVSISTINPKEFRPVDGWPDKKTVYRLWEKADPLPGTNEGEGATGNALQILLPPGSDDAVQPVPDYFRHY